LQALRICLSALSHWFPSATTVALLFFIIFFIFLNLFLPLIYQNNFKIYKKIKIKSNFYGKQFDPRSQTASPTLSHCVVCIWGVQFTVIVNESDDPALSFDPASIYIYIYIK
jgi:hypothetical protein